MRSVRHRRAGAVLLEAIVAIAILGVAGTAAVALAHDALGAARRAHRADVQTQRATAFLQHVALWPREDLDRRLGDRAQGAWRLRIDRTRPDVYDLALVDTLTGIELLRTAAYRPDSAHAP